MPNYHHPDFANQGPAGDLIVDVCVYGGTAGGIAAAVQAARGGLRVVVVEPAAGIECLSASGLCLTDIRDMDAIG